VLEPAGSCSTGRMQGSDWLMVEGDDDVPALNPRVACQHKVWQHNAHALSTQHFVDTDFPPGPRSVDGRRDDVGVGCTDFFKSTMSDLSKVTAAPAGADDGTLCHCGQPAQLRRVERRGPTQGRPYFACPSRACNFFEFADRGSTLAALDLEWRRFPAGGEWQVVRDGGFRPEDLQQGGVGDCWFMSALAVVAERQELMAKLVPNLGTLGDSGGCHEVRLFLDGHWTSFLIDDYLPTTKKQRRPTPDGGGLAFGRCADRQLWVSFVEKAYAKAHGAYNAISGGQTSEALLDLTGAPTETVQFRDPAFDADFFWVRLLSLLQAGCLIGCGTNAETVEELGLVGQHAYSVLDARDEPVMLPMGGGAFGVTSGRSLRVRNPWGEWTRREQDEMLAELGVPVTPGDVCFWMQYADFVRGFAVADICHARAGWHGRSFDAEFDGGAASGGGSVGSRTALRVRARKTTECWFMAIQPTERGKKLKRPRGYYLNDLSLLLVAADTGETVDLMLGGAKRDLSMSAVLDADREYLLIPISFKSSRGPFVLRVYAADAVCAQVCAPSDPALAWESLHRFVLRPVLPLSTQRLVHRLPNQAGRLMVVEGSAMALGIVVNEHATAALSVLVTAAGNHASVRDCRGHQEGAASTARNAEGTGGAAREPGRRKGEKDAKPDWREHFLETMVPPRSMKLVWVAVALVEQHYEFSLEGISAEQLPGEVLASVDTCAALEPSHPFAARPLTGPAALSGLPGCEDVSGGGGRGGRGFEDEDDDEDDLELLAAIAASCAEAHVDDRETPPSAAVAWQREEEAEDTSDEEAAELALALQVSLEASASEPAPAPAPAPASASSPPAQAEPLGAALLSQVAATGSVANGGSGVAAAQPAAAVSVTSSAPVREGGRSEGGGTSRGTGEGGGRWSRRLAAAAAAAAAAAVAAAVIETPALLRVLLDFLSATAVLGDVQKNDTNQRKQETWASRAERRVGRTRSVERVVTS